jgi:hypothetical protein
LEARVPTICSAPIREKNMPNKLIATDIREYFFSDSTALRPTSFFSDIRRVRIVTFHVHSAFRNASNTPTELNANPELHKNAIFLLLDCRTVLAKVRMTPDMTDNTICIHQLIHDDLLYNLLRFITDSNELSNTTTSLPAAFSCNMLFRLLLKDPLDLRRL